MATGFNGGATCGISAGGVDARALARKNAGSDPSGRRAGVARDTVEGALKELEREGVLRGQGPGRGRAIDPGGGSLAGGLRTGLRVGILAYDAADRRAIDIIELLHELGEKGHVASLAAKTMSEMDHRVDRVARLVRETPADAWVILAGSRDVLEWFAANEVAAFAYAGRANRVPLASIVPDKTMPFRSAIRRLFDLGHRRIAMLVREDRPQAGAGLDRTDSLEELEALGISTGPYNLPDWEGTVKGFHAAWNPCSGTRLRPP